MNERMVLHTYFRSSAAFRVRIGLNLKGLADCCLVRQVFSAKRFKLPLDRYPVISAIYSACMAMNEFTAAAPQNQPDYHN